MKGVAAIRKRCGRYMGWNEVGRDWYHSDLEEHDQENRGIER
jgi:hypothetical protein